MTLFLQQRNSLSGAFQNLVSIIPSFLNSSVSAHRLRELTELPKEIHSIQNQKDLFLTKGGLEVRLENVTFSYTKGKQVFRDIRRREDNAAAFDPRLDRAGYRKGNLKGTGRNEAEVKCRHKSMLFICSAGQYTSCREYRRESEYRQRRSIQGRNEDGS